MEQFLIKNTDILLVQSLKEKIIFTMQKIRSLTPHEVVNPALAKGSEVWNGIYNGREVNRIIIYLRSSGCSWAISSTKGEKSVFRAGCLDCEHSVAGTTFGKPITSQHYVEQFITEYEKYDFSEAPILCLYNEGNFFNESELPHDARVEILRIISQNKTIKSLIVESLPEYISEYKLCEMKEILGDKEVEIGIGLESSNELIRDLCINKSYSLKMIRQIIPLVKKYFKVLAYVLVKPSFLSEKEALIDGIETINYAFKNGIDIVSIEPVNPSRYNMSGFLARLGLYQQVWLWTVLEILKETDGLGVIRVGGFQFEPKYEMHSQNCEKCTDRIRYEIDRFNGSGDLSRLLSIECICKQDWEAEISKAYPPILERIQNYIDKVEVELNLK